MTKKFWEREGFSIKTFAQIFTGVYDLYYDARYEQTDEDAMMLEGARLMQDKTNVPLLKMLADYRQDILTSDREVASFAVTYNLYLTRFAD